MTAGDARRRGHARALVQQLQDRLREAGIKKLVVLIEPGVSSSCQRGICILICMCVYMMCISYFGV